LRNDRNAGSLGEWGIVVLFLVAFLIYVGLQLPAVAAAWESLLALIG
jgi:hypothetical protein